MKGRNFESKSICSFLVRTTCINIIFFSWIFLFLLLNSFSFYIYRVLTNVCGAFSHSCLCRFETPPTLQYFFLYLNITPTHDRHYFFVFLLWFCINTRRRRITPADSIVLAPPSPLWMITGWWAGNCNCTRERDRVFRNARWIWNRKMKEKKRRLLRLIFDHLLLYRKDVKKEK